MSFVNKEQLEKEYIAFGRFYILNYNNGQKRKCRSLLEIFNREDCSKLKGTDKFDAVFIMMNPGSGKPKVEYKQHDKNVNQVKSCELNKIKLVEADPDDTQYQVMRVMRVKGWKYVRVINLSDYINPKSENFYPMIKEALSFDREFIHSIFSNERKKEIDRVFKSENKFKVIAAWGVNTKLGKLIKLALANSYVEERIGNNKTTYKRKRNFYYYHPLPTNPTKQPIWLKEILEKLKD